MQHHHDAQIDNAALQRRWERAEQERAALIRLARRRGLSLQDAEDCVHEAMLRVVPRPDLDEERIGALLTTVVSRIAIDFHRRAKTTHKVVAKASVVMASLADGDPATTVCDRDEARWSAGLLDDLPANQREALIAKAEGRSIKQIAMDMATTPKAIESLISRARSATRQAMASGMSGVFAWLRRLSLFDPAVTATAGAVVVALALPGLGGGSAPGHPGDRNDGARQAAAPTAIASVSRAAEPGPASASASKRGDGGRRTPTSGAPEGPPPPPRPGTASVSAPTPGGGTATFSGDVRPGGYESFEDKIDRCRTYGPDSGVSWDQASAPEPRGLPGCRFDHGSIFD